jgi:hypothetical protein
MRQLPRIRPQGRDLPGEGSKPLTQEAPRSSVREYLSSEQLAEVTPWNVSAIEKMVSRGVLKRDVHYFQPFGRRTQLVFKWSTIVDLIESRSADQSEEQALSLLRKGPLDVAQAEKNLGRLLDR